MVNRRILTVLAACLLAAGGLLSAKTPLPDKKMDSKALWSQFQNPDTRS